MTKGPRPVELQKFNRLFELIRLLSRPPYYRAPELAERLGTSPKTIYNYINLLDSVGFQVDSNQHSQHYLHLERPKAAGDLLSQDEAEYLQSLLWQQGDGDVLRNALLRKLNAQYALAPVIENITRYQKAAHRNSLQQAIDEDHRVQLQNYRDGGGNVGHRTVEPVNFLEDFVYLWAFDIKQKAYRRYRLDRIGNVVILPDPIQGKHRMARTDVFGWTSGDAQKHLCLRLSPRAQQLLREEHPATRPYIREHRGATYLEVDVYGWPPVARFIMGLGPSEVTIEKTEDSEALRRCIHDRWGEGF